MSVESEYRLNTYLGLDLFLPASNISIPEANNVIKIGFCMISNIITRNLSYSDNLIWATTRVAVRL